MRVKISYGVDVESVPEEVERIGKTSLSELNQAVASLERILADIPNCDGDYELIVRLIQKVRMNLTRADNVLADVSSILEGLNSYIKGDQNVPEG